MQICKVEESVWGGGGGGAPKFEHIFVAVITFSPFLLCKYF